ncbi:MAG: DUF2760 domain-containing protein [Bryobacteraceae bacterium]
MSRISDAFSSFFSILFSGQLSPEVARTYGYIKAGTVSKPAAATSPAAAASSKPQAGPADGAVQFMALLQRDARLVDFLMEDISAYSDDQVGAAVRDVQTNSRQVLTRHLKLAAVLDGVEGDYAKTQGLPANSYRLIGNVPPNGKAPGGLLRHKGWKAEKVDLPASGPSDLVAPAEIEVE